jgi:hypothetical protein
MLNLKSSLVHDILREVFEAILPQLTRPNGRQLVLATNFSQIYCKDAKKDLIKSPVLATMKSVPEATDPPAKKWGQQIHLEMEGTIHFQVQKATTTNNKKKKKKKPPGGVKVPSAGIDLLVWTKTKTAKRWFKAATSVSLINLTTLPPKQVGSWRPLDHSEIRCQDGLFSQL